MKALEIHGLIDVELCRHVSRSAVATLTSGRNGPACECWFESFTRSDVQTVDSKVPFGASGSAIRTIVGCGMSSRAALRLICVSWFQSGSG